MKWGRRKSSSASSSRTSFISHVSPLSWLSKFKKMRINSEPIPAQLKQKGKQNSPSVSSPQYTCGSGGRFYGGDDEGFWRLSFGEENHEDKKSKDILKSVVYNLDDKHVSPSSRYRSGRWNAKKQERRKEGTSKVKENERELVDERKLPNNREKEFENLRRRFERKSQRVLQEQVLKLEREAEDASTISVEKEVLQFESPRTIWTPKMHSLPHSVDLKNSGLRGIKEDRVFNTQSFQKIDRPSEEKLASERQSPQQTEDCKTKTEKQRQSIHVSREIQRRKPKHSSKVRVYSPRMASKVEICRIKALEDMRKERLKMKKAKEKIVEENEGLDSFAVVKFSVDPLQDFRDSMVEMIREKQISEPEEMEELLACYLTLNSDEYHDLIIEVFRQVWFDMNQDSLGV